MKAKISKSMAILLFVAGLFASSCTKNEDDKIIPAGVMEEMINTAGIDMGEFRSYVNSGHIGEILPIVNRLLGSLPDDWSDGQKLQVLAAWLRSSLRIIDAFVDTDPHLPSPIAEIAISFIEKGIVKDFMLDISMTGPLEAVACHEQYTPRDVFIKTKYYFTIERVFNFINSLDLDVEEIRYGVYVSAMPPHNLQYILDGLNARPYTNDGNTWWVTGYLHYQTDQITVFPQLFGMKNRDYQRDWIRAMKEYQLVERIDHEYGGYVIQFKVPEGREKYWKAKFMEYAFVEWSELNSIMHITRGSSQITE